ncbi:hypothetical protein ABZY03_02345 [Streptomyces klenkii]|uniref:hypothetical protein n=1 Tax=Streptomyces klenkii TaxID=1420899 RepID=UPI0033BA9765
MTDHARWINADRDQYVAEIGEYHAHHDSTTGSAPPTADAPAAGLLAGGGVAAGVLTAVSLRLSGGLVRRR